ncbi:MAG: hypothetical protein ACYDAN_13940, partial [Candidatus Limnocylindrales bacterium]
GGPAGAARWRPIPTPAGRTAWVLTADEVTSHGRCGPWPVPQSIAGQRSITCAGVGVPACLRLVARVQAGTPGVPYPGGDLALAMPACPAPATACGGQAAAVAVPPGWAGGVASMQAAMLTPASGAFRLLAAAAAPDYAFDAISRPALPLPIGAAEPTSRACSATLIGDLRAAAWDPRVAWVGAIGVVWPPGTSVRFADLPALTVPRPFGSYRFVVGAPVLVQGSLDPRLHAFVACGVQPGSAPESSPASGAR